MSNTKSVYRFYLKPLQQRNSSISILWVVVRLRIYPHVIPTPSKPPPPRNITKYCVFTSACVCVLVMCIFIFFRFAHSPIDFVKMRFVIIAFKSLYFFLDFRIWCVVLAGVTPEWNDVRLVRVLPKSRRLSRWKKCTQQKAKYIKIKNLVCNIIQIPNQNKFEIEFPTTRASGMFKMNMFVFLLFCALISSTSIINASNF